MKRTVVLGTRGSELALAQTEMVEAALRSRRPELEIERRIIKTSGDETISSPADSEVSRTPANPAAGRKGLFSAEIEKKLLAEEIDIAVHSAKDLPSAPTDGITIAAVLPRGPVDDVLVSSNAYYLESLPRGGRVATGSVRRRHQLRWKRPDLELVELRGNVPTRLRKLSRERWDAILLARAGLERLGLISNGEPIQFEQVRLSISVLPQDVFVPAGGQGIIAMQIRSDDRDAESLLEPITDVPTGVCLRAEREFLRLLQGDCNQPVGVCAIVQGTGMKIRAQIFRPGAMTPHEGVVEGESHDSERLAAKLFSQINDH